MVVIWIIAALATAVTSWGTFVEIGRAVSAQQQMAAASVGLFTLAAIYVFSRALAGIRAALDRKRASEAWRPEERSRSDGPAREATALPSEGPFRICPKCERRVKVGKSTCGFCGQDMNPPRDANDPRWRS